MLAVIHKWMHQLGASQVGVHRVASLDAIVAAIGASGADARASLHNDGASVAAAQLD